MHRCGNPALLAAVVLFSSAVPIRAGGPALPAPVASQGSAQASAESAAPPLEPRPLRIQSHTLANGLRLFVIEDHTTPILNLQVWYHVGSKDERPGRTGFAHLFEHLMFKGSAHVQPEEHARIIEASGGTDNAYTNDDVTVFWETVPSNFLERVLWLEADRMATLTVDEAGFHSERNVVKEERRLRVEDPPYGRVFEDLYAAAFSVHPYHHTTIGSMDDLNRATLADVQEFYRAFYRPDNATIVIVGDAAPEACWAAAQKYFGGIPKPDQPVPRQKLVEPPQTEEKQLTKSYGANSPLPAVLEGFKIPAAFTPDSYPLNLASNILSAGESSRLYRRLVYETQIAAQTAGIGNFTEDPNLFLAFAVMNQGKTAEEGRAAIEAVLAEIKNDPVSPGDLAKAKNQMIAGFIFGRVGDQQTADSLGLAAVIGNDPELVNRDPGLFLRVTAADVQAAARKYLIAARCTLMIVSPPAR